MSGEWQLVAECSVQIDTRFLPIALHRPFGYAAKRANLRERKPTKELEIDDLRERWVEPSKLIERVADARELHMVGDVVGDVGVKRGDLETATPLLRLPVADIIDDQSA